jgi:hypothetical protein
MRVKIPSLELIKAPKPSKAAKVMFQKAAEKVVRQVVVYSKSP